MRVVLDTNVILSAILFGGKPRKVLEAALSGSLKICISESIIEELQNVLQRPKFGLTSQILQGVISELTSIAGWVLPKKHLELIEDDPTDNQVLDCAIEANADYIISGDGHLLQLGKCGSTLIMNPDSFVRILGEMK
jgi:putative PIN family toxin of toxin-antitoxin system